MKLSVEERGLEDHIRAGSQRLDRLRMLGLQGGAVHRFGGNDVEHALTCQRIPGAELGHETVQHPVLMDVAQRGGALQHFVDGEGRLLREAQFLVQRAQQLVLAGGGRHEVAGGKHQILRLPCIYRIEKKHRAPRPLS